MEKFTPLVYDDSARTHRPADDKAVLKPSHIPINTDVQGKSILKNDAEEGLSAVVSEVLSKDSDNALVLGGDGGVLFRLSSAVSADADNVLKVSATDKKLTCVPRDRSDDEGNFLRFGLDGGYYIGAGDILSDAAGNPLTTGTDGKILLNPCLLPPAPVIVSTEEGNLIRADRADDSAALTYSDVVSADAKNLIVKGTDGKLKVSAAEISSTDAGNLLYVDAAGHLGLRAADLIDRADVCKRGNLLLLSDANKLEVGASLKYNSLTGQLDLLNGLGAVVSTISVPTSPSLLESVTLEDNPAGQPAGQYLHFTFRKGDGTVENAYVNVSSLKDVYTEGKGITLHGQEINVKLAPKDSGLSFDEDGCLQAGFETLAGPGLVVTEDPESLGKQYEVAVCEGLQLIEKVVAGGGGETVHAVGVNLDTNQKIVDLVDDPDGGCPKLSAQVNLTATSKTALSLTVRDGSAIGKNLTVKAPLVLTTGDNQAIDLTIDPDEHNAVTKSDAGLRVIPAVTDLLLGTNENKELFTTFGSSWDDEEKEVVISGREGQRVTAVKIPVVISVTGEATYTPAVGATPAERNLRLVLNLSDGMTVETTVDVAAWFPEP